MRAQALLFPILTALAAGALAVEPASYVAGRDAFVAQQVPAAGAEQDALAALLQRAIYRQAIIDAMERPYEGQPWPRYRALFVTQERIGAGLAFWRAQGDALERAQATYGVPPEIVVAILGVETQYGRRLGEHRVIDALTTLGFSYPRRGEFFRRELAAFLRLTREEGLDPLSVLGSYAGAMGQPQFIPSSYRAYAVDFDGDGRRDLWQSAPDVIGSVANYLRAHGWEAGAPVAVRVNGAVPGPEGLPGGLEVAGARPLDPKIPAGQLRAAGLAWGGEVADAAPVSLIRLPLAEGRDGAPPAEEVWLGLGNLRAISRYNESNLYALAVFQLGQELLARRAPGS